MLAKRTYKNQITIPKTIMEAFPATEYFDVSRQENAIILRPVTLKPVKSRLERIRDKVRTLGLTPADLEAAIQWVRQPRL